MGTKTGIIKQCLYCGKDIYVKKCCINITKFCSHSCISKYNWKTGASVGKPRRGITKKCVACGKDFYVPRCRDRIKYCSKECYLPFLKLNGYIKKPSLRKPKKIVVCKTCGIEFVVDGYKKEQYCSVRCSCKTEWFKKSNKPLHNGKYIRITINGKRILQHRYIMENHIGRTLTSNESVHHIDGNPKNNNIDNLQLMTISDHRRLEAKLLKT